MKTGSVFQSLNCAILSTEEVQMGLWASVILLKASMTTTQVRGKATGCPWSNDLCVVIDARTHTLHTLI